MLRGIRWFDRCFLRAVVRVIVPLAATAACLPAAQAQVNVSVGVPGVYGSLDIGGYPQPQTIYRQPIVVDRGAGYVDQPLYLHVPADHASHWKRYCRNYDACGRPVYFVRDDWYRNVYTPRYREMHAHGGDDHGGPHGDDHRGPGDRGHDDHDHGDHGHDHN